MSTIACDTCDCVGIKSIVNNRDGTTTITLTNGKSTTYQSKGDKGDKGDTGATGAPGANGTNGAGYIWNQETDTANTTIGSFETIKSASTDYTNPNKTLVNVGDSLFLYSLFELTDPSNPIDDAAIQMLMGATQLGGNQGTSGGLIQRVVYEIKISLTDNTSGAMRARVIARVYNYSAFGSGFHLINNGIFEQNILDLASLDFATTNYTFYCQVNVANLNNYIKCRAFYGLINKITI